VQLDNKRPADAGSTAGSNGSHSNGHSSHSNGNGQHGYQGSHDNGNPDAPQHNLLLRLPRTNDLEADTHRMQDIYDLLASYQGDDLLTLYVPNGVGTVVLRSRYTVRASPALVSELEGLVGKGCVEVRGR
jgi:DNA polymerase-3 subunit alpha